MAAKTRAQARATIRRIGDVQKRLMSEEYGSGWVCAPRWLWEGRASEAAGADMRLLLNQKSQSHAI